VLGVKQLAVSGGPLTVKKTLEKEGDFD